MNLNNLYYVHHLMNLYIDDYKSKNEWSEILLKDDMSEQKLKQLLKEDDKKIDMIYCAQEQECDKIYGGVMHCFDIGKNIMNNIFSRSVNDHANYVDCDQGIIDICYLHLKYKNLDTNHCMDILEKMHIRLLIGGMTIISLSMIINLFFAKMLKIDIVEENDVIIYPIVIMSMCGNYFNLNYLKYHDVELEFSFDLNNNFIIEKLMVHAHKDLINKNTHNMRENIVVQTQFGLYDTPQNEVGIYHSINYLLFENSKNSLEDGVEEVKLVLNNGSEIKFDYEDISVFNIMGREYYGVSLCPELSNRKGLRRFLKGKSTIKKNGINFSLYNPKIFIKPMKLYRIWFISFNLFRTMSWMGGLAFST
jgi:hypothetical protein